MKFLEEFVDWAAVQLQNDSDGLDYVLGRGVPSDLATRLRIGFSNADFEVNPSEDPMHSDECRYDRTRRCDSCRFDAWSHIWEPGEPARPKLLDSVVLPLTSYSNRIVGIQVRNIREKSFDTFVLRRRPEPYFFGIGPNIERIFSEKTVFITEAPFDSMVIQNCVAPNCVAVCTNSVSGDQARVIRRFARRVYMCMDSDAAGRKGARDFSLRNESSLDVVNVRIPDRYKIRDESTGKSKLVKDFNELQQNFGNDVLRKVIEEQL